jgi:RNA polymerase sigma factor (sigma-70 family)
VHEQNNTRETLLIKLKNQNNDSAWSEFSIIYKGFIWSVLMKMDIPTQDQEDLVQDVLLKAWKALPDFDYNRSQGRFRNWLSFVTANTARTYFRTFNRNSKLFCSKDSDHAEQAEIEKITETEWKKFISKMAWDKVSKNLSEPACQSFELLSEGLSAQQVAEKLNIPYNTVCVYKKRVINKISKEIADLEDDIG